jgi:hypothetical protein
MGTGQLLVFGIATEIAFTLIGFYWVRDMLRALAIGIDARFTNVDRELQRVARGSRMTEAESEV